MISIFLVDESLVSRRETEGFSTRNGPFLVEKSSVYISVLIVSLLCLLFVVCYNYYILYDLLFV